MNYKVVPLVLLAGLVGYASGVTFHGHDSEDQTNENDDEVMNLTHGSANGDDTQHNEPEPVMSDTVPSVNVQYTQSKNGSYNLRFLTDNFVFTPSMVDNGEVLQNKGHAHLYINGMKVGRVYGEWYHVPSHWLKEGKNTLKISLHADNHKQWFYDELPIESEFQIEK